MSHVSLSIFTPAYNRANTLPRLFQSLRQQSCNDFEWIVINDGSSDETDELFQQWLKEETQFPIRYQSVVNGGKNRAVNLGAQIAEGDYFFIVDSDDYLQPDAVSCVLEYFRQLPKDEKFIGISTIRGGIDGKPLNGQSLIDKTIGYVDCTNLERCRYNLTADMAEVFFTEKLKLYPFPVWKGEKFTPEAVIWDRMALDGYKLRWFDKIIYLCEYQEGGLSASSWRLLRDNPMGYAMLFNIRLEYSKQIRKVINYTLQYISCCILAGEKKQILKCSKPISAVLLFPAGWVLAIRRKFQLKKVD